MERFNTEEAADYLRFHKNTLAIWRSKGIGPRFIKISKKRVFYFKKDLDEWLNSNLFNHTGEY